MADVGSITHDRTMHDEPTNEHTSPSSTTHAGAGAPWPAPTARKAPVATAAADGSDRSTAPGAVAGLAAVIGIVAGIAIGALVGRIVYGISAGSCAPSDGWCGLGAALFGLGAGVVSGGAAYVVAGVVTIVRTRPAGSRAGLVLFHLALPFVLIALLSVVGGMI